MSRFLAVVLLSLVPTVAAITCWQNYNNMQMPDGVTNHTSVNCPTGISTCYKNYDMNSKMYMKGCGALYTNCTNPTQPGVTVPNICYNSTATQTNCCCNTDSCNPAPSYNLYYTFGSVAVLFLAKLF